MHSRFRVVINLRDTVNLNLMLKFKLPSRIPVHFFTWTDSSSNKFSNKMITTATWSYIDRDTFMPVNSCIVEIKLGNKSGGRYVILRRNEYWSSRQYDSGSASNNDSTTVQWGLTLSQWSGNIQGYITSIFNISELPILITLLYNAKLRIANILHH